MIRQFHRNESSWNVRSQGTTRERMFHRTKVLGNFAPEERKFHRERKFQGANVPWNESSTGAKVLSMVFSLPGTKVQRNEKAWNHYFDLLLLFMFVIYNRRYYRSDSLSLPVLRIIAVMLKHAWNACKRPQTWSKVKVCGRYVALQQGVWNMLHTALGLGLALIQYYTASWVG